jgi:hypothetical protein
MVPQTLSWCQVRCPALLLLLQPLLLLLQELLTPLLVQP